MKVFNVLFLLFAPAFFRCNKYAGSLTINTEENKNICNVRRSAFMSHQYIENSWFVTLKCFVAFYFLIYRKGGKTCVAACFLELWIVESFGDGEGF